MEAIGSILKKIAVDSPENQKILLAAYLARLFKEKGVNLSVVGGAAVQFYTQSEYVTHDLDAILFNDTTEIIESVMHGIGFKRTTRFRHFEHPVFDFVVEFPPSPVEVGSRDIRKMNLIQTHYGPVEVIRVEDIIMDRIIAGVEWGQESSLAQARLMWIKNKDHIDKQYLTDFATKEGYIKTLKKIRRVKTPL